MKTKIILCLSLTLNGLLAFKIYNYEKLNQKNLTSSKVQIKEEVIKTKLESFDQLSSEVLNNISDDIVEDKVDTQMSSIQKENFREPSFKYGDDHTSIDPVQNLEELEERIENFLVYDLNLTEEQISTYKDLKSEYLKESGDYLSSISPKGDNIMLSTEQSFEYNRIIIKHLNNLKSKLGDENYNAFMKFKDQYNQTVFKNTEPGRPVFTMEF